MSRRWWVFERPVLRDRLFLSGLVVGVVFLAIVVARADGRNTCAVVFDLVVAVPAGLLVVGIVAGSVREFRRGHRQTT